MYIRFIDITDDITDGNPSLVRFLTVVEVGKEDTEFSKWYRSHKSAGGTNSDGVEIIMTQLERIAEEGENVCTRRGHIEDNFRHERGARAFPLKDEDYTNLRLYCIWIRPNTLILTNGGIKTAKRAQDCPNNSLHFNLINRIEKVVTNEIKENRVSPPETIAGYLIEQDEFEI